MEARFDEVRCRFVSDMKGYNKRSELIKLYMQSALIDLDDHGNRGWTSGPEKHWCGSGPEKHFMFAYLSRVVCVRFWAAVSVIEDGLQCWFIC